MDQTSDVNGQDIYQIVMAYDAPPFAKEARLADINSNDQLALSAFADPHNRRYRIDSPEAVWWSTAFFLEKPAHYTPNQQGIIANRLKQAAEFFNIDALIRELYTKIAEAHTEDESKLPDDVFALRKTADDGTVVRRYPLRNPAEVRTAADYVLKHIGELPFMDRQQMAGNILVKAAECGVKLDGRDALEKTAGLGLCSGSDIAALLRQRMRHVEHALLPEIRDDFTKIADTFAEMGGSLQHPHTIFQAAALVDSFDRANGLTPQYGTRLQPPEETLFAVTEKVAAELSRDLVGNALTGNYYQRDALSNIPMSELKAALGDELASNLGVADAWPDTEKMASIIPTLPLSDALAFDAAAAAAGIAPLATKTANWVTELSDADLVRFAAAYRSEQPLDVAFQPA